MYDLHLITHKDKIAYALYNNKQDCINDGVENSIEDIGKLFNINIDKYKTNKFLRVRIKLENENIRNISTS